MQLCVLGDPHSSCHLIDFCADLPCGPGASCHNSRGSFKCQCPTGTVGDPYNEGCRPAVECSLDSDCPSAAACDKFNGIYKCRDVCQQTMCGPNAECVAVDHAGHCTCRNGYEGSPNDAVRGCSPRPVSCRFTSDCPANTYCYGERCRRTLAARVCSGFRTNLWFLQRRVKPIASVASKRAAYKDSV